IARALGASRSAVQCSQRWKLLVRRDRRASDPRPRPSGYPRVTRPWTDVESAQLLRLLEEHGRFDYGELSKRLPGFTYGQMYQGLQRLVYAGRPRPWTRAERRRLAQLVHAHPGDWPRVAAGLSARTPLQCRLMYGARMLGGPAAHKRWTPAESARLVRLVNACRRPPLAPDAAAIARALDAGAYACALERDLLAAASAAAPEPAQPPDAAHRPVPWLLVATYMPGRTPMQCRCKWQRLKEAAELPAHSGPWSPAEDLALYTLCADIPGHWRAIQRRLPRRRNMNAIRARHTLISRVVRVIRACRPAWDPRADAMAEVHMRCEVLSWFHASAEGYRPDDPFDCPLDTCEWTLLLCLAALLYYRNALSAFTVAGAVACTLTAKLLKLLLRHERPAHCPNRLSFGMPSTHSASIVYFATIMSYIAADMLPARRAIPAAAGLCLLGAAAALSRTLNGHHTLLQVAAGCGLGVSFASVWWHHRDLFLPSISYILTRCGL
ncbi:hypothetical protein IWW55_003229, partial [Coemansia sp. RSA 2706]